MPPSEAFEPENELERELVRAAEHDDRRSFLVALARGEVYLPAPAPEDGDAEELPPGASVPVPVWAHEDRRFVPVFTSEGQLARLVPAATGYRRLALAALLEVLEGDGWIGVNPGGALGLLAPADEVRAAGEGAEEGERVLIGAPAEEPTRLLEEVTAFARERPEVLAAWRAQIVLDRPGGSSQPLVGLELAPGTPADPVFHALTDRVDERGAGPAAFAQVEREEPSDVAAGLLRHEPFYVRG